MYIRIMHKLKCIQQIHNMQILNLIHIFKHKSHLQKDQVKANVQMSL